MASVKQMTVRMTNDEWKSIKHYLTDKDKSFSEVALEAIKREIGLTGLTEVSK